MGLLKDLGEVYSYEQSVPYQLRLQKMAALQFLHIFQKYHAWKNPLSCEIKWGDEVEGHRFRKNQQSDYELAEGPLPTLSFPVMLQYGRWMFEMIPPKPHLTHCNLQDVVQSFRERYAQLNSLLGNPYLTIPAVPFLGTHIEEDDKKDITQSQIFSDKHIADHPRFRSLTRNIRERRGKKVEILVPIFEDSKTEMLVSKEDEPFAGKIHMDAMGFGMGLACLQCTFATKDISHARYLHDQLHIFSPLFLALTAGTPIVKGKLSNWDVRWKIIEESVDDRTPQQLDPKHPKFQPRSRYSAINHFIWDSVANLACYNDEPTRVNEEVVNLLKKQAELRKLPLDEKLIHHLGVLTSRQFLVMHEKFVELDEDSEYLFQMINSTNWNSVRFKVPLQESMGWRVEFRTMEVQVTPDQNAAFSLLVFLLVKLMSEMPNLNFYIPISKVNENFERAHAENAILKQKFYFRVNIYESGLPIIRELTLKEIFFGSKEQEFQGMFHEFVKMLEDPNTTCPRKKQRLQEILATLETISQFVQSLVEGKRLTLAQWMRKYVMDHKAYKQDSIVPQCIINDLMDTLIRITKGQIQDDNFKRIFKL